ncbi:MAG: vanadium-dependent haloperoxidase [Acidobacteria bacterium]|nr:vanadium-dependent haloperoxidase [Acidobacteriota bacterium]MCI0721190.1 vanadium-dependent haloperoxidase [Acidobacteriota bacterium]
MTTRRTFIQSLMGLAAASTTASAATHVHRFDPVGQRMAVGKVEEKAVHPCEAEHRRTLAMKLREQCARHQCQRALPEQVANDDEVTLPCWIGSFAKGLPHTQSGEVEPGCYESLLDALASGKSEAFQKLRRGSGMRLVSPQAAFSFHLEGGDSHSFSSAPAPGVGSAQGAAEMVELYWQALGRDIPFCDYEHSPLIHQAAAELGSLCAFAGPRDSVPTITERATAVPSAVLVGSSGQVTSECIFRGSSPGDVRGPYVSQFLWKLVPYGSSRLEQRYRTPSPGNDFVNNPSEWPQIQTGVPPWREYRWEPKPRYIITGRDLAEYVHFDFLYQAFLNAALILENVGPENLLNTQPFLSETNPYKHSKTQVGFVTFGCAHIADWLGRVTTAAMKACWFQKWMVHRRLRPEEFGGLIHRNKTIAAGHPVHEEVLESQALQEIYQRCGSYLLPQAYPEGCPLHPAYPSGHATVSGACATILKAFFDENMVVPDCVVPSQDGHSVVPYKGPALTVKGEVEKLAFNIAMGRNFAGIHYRSDATAGLRLGEQVAITVMEDLVNTFNEDFEGFKFTRFDGTPVHIQKMS